MFGGSEAVVGTSTCLLLKQVLVVLYVYDLVVHARVASDILQRATGHETSFPLNFPGLSIIELELERAKPTHKK